MGHQNTTDPPLAQNLRNDPRETLIFDLSLAQPGLIATQGEDPAMGSLPVRAADFEVAHDDGALPLKPQIDKWVGDEHADGIQHIRVMVAVSYHQQIIRFL